ncbi:MAG: hypothetical protein WCP98_07750 [Actinomycetes bacterium]
MGLELPEKLLLDRVLVVLVLHVHEVQTPALAVERFDAGDHAATVADGAEEAGAGDLGARRGARSHLRPAFERGRGAVAAKQIIRMPPRE